MRFNIFGRKTLEVVRRDNQWVACYCGEEGKKRIADDVQIPASLSEAMLQSYLADIFHEWASAAHPEVTVISRPLER